MTAVRCEITTYAAGAELGNPFPGRFTLGAIHSLLEGLEPVEHVERITAAFVRSDGSRRLWRTWKRSPRGGFECLR